MALAILNGKYKFPDAEQDPYSDDFRELVKSMLVVEPKERADIHAVRFAF